MPLALTRHFALHRILPVLMVVLFVRACKWQFNQIRNGNGRQGKYKKFGKAKSSALPLASASEMGEKSGTSMDAELGHGLMMVLRTMDGYSSVQAVF